MDEVGIQVRALSPYDAMKFPLDPHPSFTMEEVELGALLPDDIDELELLPEAGFFEEGMVRVRACTMRADLDGSAGALHSMLG